MQPPIPTEEAITPRHLLFGTGSERRMSLRELSYEGQSEEDSEAIQRISAESEGVQ